MNATSITELGTFCEWLKGQSLFQSLTAVFEHQIVDAILATEPHEAKKRESLYATHAGLRDLLGLMDQFIAEKDKLLNPEPSTEIDDDGIPQID
jgi:hypothetical protein